MLGTAEIKTKTKSLPSKNFKLSIKRQVNKEVQTAFTFDNCDVEKFLKRPKMQRKKTEEGCTEEVMLKLILEG